MGDRVEIGISATVLVATFLLMGWLTAPAGDPARRWRRTLAFLGAVALALCLVALGFVLIVLLVLLGGVAATWADLDIDLFLGTLGVVLLAGALSFIISAPVLRRMSVTLETLTIIEYYIQWMLIYVTIYQVTIDQLDGIRGLVDDAQLAQEVQGFLSTVLDPAFLIVLLLPVLISVWVTVAIAKLRIDNEKQLEDAFDDEK